MKIVSLVVAFALALPGCSFIVVRDPKVDPTGKRPPECDDDTDAPWLDGLAAGSWVLPVLISGAFAADECDTTDDIDCDEAVVGLVASVGMLVLHSWSAIYGSRKKSKCKRAKLDYVAQQPAPAPPAIDRAVHTVGPPGASLRRGPDGQACAHSKITGPKIKELHGRAAAAAEAGRCEAVLTYSREIAARDSAYYRAVFRCDSRITTACPTAPVPTR